MFVNFDPKHSKYSVAHRDLMEQVVDNWKLWDEEEKYKVLHDYMNDVYINLCLGGPVEDFLTELRIMKTVHGILSADHRDLLAAYRIGDIEYYVARKEFFKVKTIMLEFLESLMKTATISEFLKSLDDLPEEEFSSVQIRDAMMLDSLKSLDHLALPEDHKNCLMQKLVGNDITIACEESKLAVSYCSKKLQHLGVETREDNQTNHGDPCTDMDSLKKRFEVVRNQVREKENDASQMYDCPIRPCVTYKQFVEMLIERLEKRVTSMSR